MAITVDFYRKSGKSDFLYDLHGAVGAGGKNRPNDVRLVQTLLHIVYYAYRGASLPPPSGESGIAVDGKFGNRTYAHISHFKQWLRSNGVPNPKDGVIDPVRGSVHETTKAGTLRVIIWLNDAALNASKKAGVPGEFYLHNARRVDATFQVDPSLYQELQSNKRLDLDYAPQGPVPLPVW